MLFRVLVFLRLIAVDDFMFSTQLVRITNSFREIYYIFYLKRLENLNTIIGGQNRTIIVYEL